MKNKATVRNWVEDIDVWVIFIFSYMTKCRNVKFNSIYKIATKSRQNNDINGSSGKYQTSCHYKSHNNQ